MTPGGQRLEYGTHVTSEDGSPGQGPVDPVYDALFRPEDAQSAPASGATSEPAEPIDAPPAGSPLSADPDPSPGADTGRLFRSQGVQDRSDAVLALDSGRFTRLRTLERTTDPVGSSIPVASEVVIDDHAPEGAPLDDLPDPELAAMLAPAVATVHTPPGDPVQSQESPRSRSRRSRTPRGISGPGLRAGGVYLIVIGVTVIVAFINAVLGGGSLGWPTGVALLASSVYAAVTVRGSDDTAAFLIPPVAFLIAALTAGQLFLDANEGSVLNRAVIVFFSLADNWIWIIGSTLIALVIVLVRRRRS